MVCDTTRVPAVILLLGGTSETTHVAEALARRGYQVIISKVTNIPQNIPEHPNIKRRIGALDKEQMMQLVSQIGCDAIIDATHPYASQVTDIAQDVATVWSDR